MAAAAVLVVAVALGAAPAAHAFRTYVPAEDAGLLRSKGRTTMVQVDLTAVPAGAPRGGVDLVAFPGHAVDGAGDVPLSPAPAAGVDGLLPDSERAAADVILP
uniref:Uncharacterized protein n=1 Tax=Oryza brachyantha TaxID=4533 RepID=J3MGS3_ORYBR